MSSYRTSGLSIKPGAPSLPRSCLCGKGGIWLPFILVAAAASLLAGLPASAQYPGQVTKHGKESPELRSIAVLEWTGDPGQPKASRLVPVAVLDGGQLQDGGIYLARPQPLALAGEVEYELEQDGKPIGLFDIRNAGQEQGSWVGYGAWKPMPIAKPKPSAKELANTHIDDDVQGDEPVLHRKRHADDAPDAKGGASSPSSGSGSDEQAPAPDPDRPTLHRSPSSDSTSNAGSSQDSDSTNGPALHRRDSGDSESGSTESAASTTASSPSDPDRPVLHKSKPPAPATAAGNADALADVSDPDRPRLRRGKSNGGFLEVLPSLLGLPPNVQQTVAVSDAKSRPPHLWNYAWSSPEDEARMKLSLEDTARGALGLNPPPAKLAPKRTTAQAGTRTAASRKAKPAPPPPAPLVDEEFRVFELAYGSGATMVLTAHTDGPAAQQKFVTLVAQPDLYGNVQVLLKSVTDGAHLDDNPRMRLVDAVDAMADNRGELLFELRGATQRQFALYRVLRGQIDKLFVSGGGDFATEAMQ